MASIEFLLGDAVQRVDITDPTLTVLDWLRGPGGRRGTKEGCAEGDCGACTVVVGELAGDGRIDYRAVNACIRFLATLDGKQLLTVEDVEGPDGTPHPVQATLVDGHGSQCGFCTPGIVMSLYAGYIADAAAGVVPDRLAIDDRLAGNLCRCTGYRPIADAAMEASETVEPPAEAARRAAAVAKLSAMQRSDTLDITADGRRFLAPVTLNALLDLRARHPQAVLLGGGTDVGLWVTKQHRRLETVIYLGDVAELSRIEETTDGWRIGAGVTFESALPVLTDVHSDLGDLVRRIGSRQIRNAGTLGGNIANGSPIGDSMPALIALGARLTLRGPNGARRMAIEDFFLGYRRTALAADEILEAIDVPKPGPRMRFATYKISKRFDQDISAVCPAYRLTFDADGRVTEARIAHGGMAAIPQRAPVAEAALTGRRFDAAAAQAAMAALAQDYQPIDDMRASAAYRMTVARNSLWRFHLECGGAAETRLARGAGGLA